MAAKLRKAKYVITVDLDESRLKLAAKLGATHTVVNSTREATSIKSKKSAQGRGCLRGGLHRVCSRYRDDVGFFSR